MAPPEWFGSSGSLIRIVLPDGASCDAAEYITELPQAAADWQIAMETLLLVAERNGPEMLARIGVMKA